MTLLAIRARSFWMADFKKLQVWQYAHTLTLETYRVAQQIRGAHHMSLRSQLIRASASIPSKIVEGRAQQSERDFGRFLRYALASASELEYHFVMGRDIGVIEPGDFGALMSQLIRVRKMLHGLLARISAVTGAPLATDVPKGVSPSLPPEPEADGAPPSPKPAAG